MDARFVGAVVGLRSRARGRATIFRSKHTVHDHCRAIYSALRVHNRVQLVNAMLRWSMPETPSVGATG